MQVPDYFEFFCRTKVVFAPGALKEVGAQAVALGGTRALVVADPVADEMGWRKTIEKSLSEAGVETAVYFDQVSTNSEIKLVNRCYEEAKEGGADLVIAIGGGSTMDTAKCANILLTEGGDLLTDHQGAYVLQRPLKPMIGIPTTAGTGAEVSFAAVIRDEEQRLKVPFVSHYLAMNTAILDPEITLGLPPFLTAATGMDALTHGIESLHSTQNQPMADALALHAIRLICQNLRDAVHRGKESLEARAQMLVASTMAGLAFSNALVGIVHAMSHAAGGLFNAHHGALNAVLLPIGMEYNLPECAPRYRLAAQAMGISTHDHSDEEAARLAIEYVRQLNRDLGLPKNLQDLGVQPDAVNKLAEDALCDASIYNNPRQPSQEELTALFQKALAV